MILEIDIATIAALAAPTVAVIIGVYLTERSANRAASAAASAAQRTAELREMVAQAAAKAVALGISTHKTLDIIQVRVNGHIEELNATLGAAIRVIESFERRLSDSCPDEENSGGKLLER